MAHRERHDGSQTTEEWDGGIKLNVSNASTTIPQLHIVQSGAGDAFVRFTEGTTDFVMGIDNSNEYFGIRGATSLAAGQPFNIDDGGRVGIGGTVAGSGKLSVSTTIDAFLPPRMTYAQMVAISSPVSGAMVYASNSGALFVYDDSGWSAITAA